MLMELVDKRHTPATAALVAFLLQPSTVYTKGEIARTLKQLWAGVTQGGPESPTLFNIVADRLLTQIATALSAHLGPGDPDPSKGFADDLLPQLLRILNAKRAFAACGDWAEATGQTFATGEGKSAFLRDSNVSTDPGYTVTGKSILPAAAAFEYLGVTLTVHGTTDASILQRAATVSSALSTLKTLRLLVRGMQTKQAIY